MVSLPHRIVERRKRISTGKALRTASSPESVLVFIYYYGWTQMLAVVVVTDLVAQAGTVCSPLLSQLPSLLTEDQPPSPALPPG